MQIEHILPATLLREQKVRVLVVGAGGTGSAVVLQLPYLDQAMRAWGHQGIDVTVIDGDTISETNCVRQPFAVTDIGANKAELLVSRINLFWGLAWKAVPEFFSADSLINSNHRCDILIGAVDTRAARKHIATALARGTCPCTYFLDFGNNASSGQYVLGQPLNSVNRQKADRLCTVIELFPEVADTSQGEDPLPSCSAAEALDRQEPFVNQTLAVSALAMLARLFRYGRLTHHGAFFNAATGRMTSLPIDPERWAKLRQQNRKRAAARALVVAA